MEVTAKKSPRTSVRAGMNEKKFFAKMGQLFASRFSVLGELMQNARRAGATRIDFTVDADSKTLSCQDNGHGINDFAALVMLMDSDWDEGVVLHDNPFGMGLFSAFYAGQTVEFLSGGQRLSLTLDDVINKRLIPVVADAQAPSEGTLVRISGADDKFFELEYKAGHPEKLSRVQNQIEKFARGFPVPVSFNGLAMCRDRALDQMPFALTDIGHVSVPGIHRGGEIGTLSTVLYFLQGLPIGETAPYGIRGDYVIVHLDSTQFVAQMPDRVRLHNALEQYSLIQASLRNTVRQFLVAQKALLTPDEMVQRYWKTCMQYDAEHLLVDIPWAPTYVFHTIGALHYESQNMFEGGVSSPSSNGLISRQDIVSGRLMAWRNAPDSVTDDEWSIVCLKVMQTHNIAALDDALPKEHWLNDLLPSAADLEFDVQPIGVSEQSASFSSGCSEHSAEIRLCDSISVTVTSSTDDQFKQSFELQDDWILEPELEQSGDQLLFNSHYLAYVCRDNQAFDHPINCFSDYTEEFGSHRDDWEDDNRSDWNRVVSNLKGAHLAAVVGGAIPNGLQFSPDQRQQLALCSVHPNATDWVYHSLSISALDDDRFEALASALGSVTAAQLKQAFETVFTPGVVKVE